MARAGRYPTTQPASESSPPPTPGHVPEVSAQNLGDAYRLALGRLEAASGAYRPIPGAGRAQAAQLPVHCGAV
jgi:hypothetical protein